jgi:hypothetical protein
MNFIKLKYFLLKKNFYYIIFFILTIYIYDGFTNIYIILKNNYESRIVKNAGYCDRQAYGFIKFINDKYQKSINANIKVVSYANWPTAEGYFYDVNKKISNDYIIIINATQKDLEKVNIYNYYIVSKHSNCYFLRKK